MMHHYAILFLDGLSVAAEQWFDAIVDPYDRTLYKGSDCPTFFLPVGFPHIEWIPGDVCGVCGPSLGERYAISLAYFLNRYCKHDDRRRGNQRSRAIKKAISPYIQDGEIREVIGEIVELFSIDQDPNWSVGSASIELSFGAHSRRFAIAHAGVPIGPYERSPHCCVPIASLHSSQCDPMILWLGMDPDEYRRKMILWIIMVHRSCSVNWDAFLGDFPSMRRVVSWIIALSTLIDRAGGMRIVMSSDNLLDSIFATQNQFDSVWGYDSISSEHVCYLGHPLPRWYPQCRTRIASTDSDLYSYSAMRDYVPGRDI